MSDSVGSVSVDVVPDARGWSEKLRAQLRDVSVNVKANADTEEANLKLDEVARTRTAKVKVNVDKNPLEQGASALDSFVGKLGLIPALAIAAGSALVPLAGALGGVAAALAAPLAIAGGGATVFAFLAGFAVKETDKQLKNIATIQKKLDGLKKGTAEYTATQKQLKLAQDALGPAQTKFASALEGLKSTFQSFISGPAGGSLLNPLTQGMKILSDILPRLAPVLRSVSGAFTTLLGGIDKAASGPGFARFMHLFARQAGSDIVAFGRIIGNLSKGLGGLFLALDKSAGHSLVDQLVRLSQAFANWGNSERGRRAIQSFMDYFHKVGPTVADTVGAVARAIGHIAHALAPLGPVVLHAITGVADGISKIPLPVLTALGATVASLVAFQKLGGFKATGLLSRGFQALNARDGSGGPVGFIKGIVGGAVQKVYVVNMPPGLGGGPGGDLAEQFKKWFPTATAAEGTAALTAPEIAAMAAIFGVGVGAQGVLTHHELTSWQKYGAHSVTPPGMFGNNTGYVDKPGQKHFVAPPLTGGISIDKAMARAKAAIAGPTTALDAMKAHAASASRQIDLVGPHAEQASRTAVKAIGDVTNKLNTIHDKKFAIIANTQSAIRSLEALQAFRLKDKYLTVYQRYQKIEQAVGPGGGMGRHATGGLISGPGTGTSDSIPSWLSNGEYVVNAAATRANRALLDQINSGRRPSYAPRAASGGGSGMPDRVTLMVDGQQFTAYVRSHADGVYHANRGYERSLGEMSR